MKIRKPKRYCLKIITKYYQKNIEVNFNDINPNEYWFKRIYNRNGNRIYWENSNGDWEKFEYNNNGNEIYCENSDGYWSKYEYDNNGRKIYHETSTNIVMDKR